jgi:hypothetical protein
MGFGVTANGGLGTDELPVTLASSKGGSSLVNGRSQID